MVDYRTVVADLGAPPRRFRLGPEPDLGSPPLVQRTSLILTGSALAAAFVSGSLPLAEPEGIHVAPGNPGPMSTRRFALAKARVATGDRERLLRTWVDESKPPHNCPTCPLIEKEDRVRVMRGYLGALRTGGGIRQATTTH